MGFGVGMDEAEVKVVSDVIGCSTLWVNVQIFGLRSLCIFRIVKNWKNFEEIDFFEQI